MNGQDLTLYNGSEVSWVQAKILKTELFDIAYTEREHSARRKSA